MKGKKKSMAETMRERVRAHAEKHSREGGMDTLALPEGVSLFKPEKGTIKFDILPCRVDVNNHPEVDKGDLWYQRTYLAHRNVGPEDKFLVCPRTIGKRCPICEEYQKLRKDPDADDKVVGGLRAKERELFNVLVDEEVMVLDMSIHLFGKFLELEILEGDEINAAFADLKGGKTLKVRWDERTFDKRKFVEAGRIDFLDREDLDEEDTLEAVVDLDKALKILPYEEIEKIFQAGDDDDGEEEAESNGNDENEEKEATKKRTLIKKKKSKEDDEEEEEKSSDDDDDDDDMCIACDGEGKTSKGKTCPICGGSGRMKPDDDEEKDEEKKDDEEEEKEEATEKKGKGRSIKRKLRRK